MEEKGRVVEEIGGRKVGERTRTRREAKAGIRREAMHNHKIYSVGKS